MALIPYWGTETHTLPVPYKDEVIWFGGEGTGLVVSVEHLVIILATVVLVALLYAFFRYTRLGIAMQATSQNQLAAFYMGIPVRRVNMLIWGLSSAICGVAALALAFGSISDDANLIDVFIEIDVGHGRCGVAEPVTAVELARAIARNPSLHFAGLQAYHGSAQHLRKVQERKAAIDAVLEPCEAQLRHAGCRGPVRAVDHWRWHGHVFQSRSAASMARFRWAPSCSWTRITRSTSRTLTSPFLNPPCSSKPRS